MQRAAQRIGGNSSLSLCKGHCETMAKGDYHSEIQRKLIETFGKTHTMSCQNPYLVVCWSIYLLSFWEERRVELILKLCTRTQYARRKYSIKSCHVVSQRVGQRAHILVAREQHSLLNTESHSKKPHWQESSRRGVVCNGQQRKASIRGQRTTATKGQKVSIPGFVSHWAHNHSWGSRHAQRHAWPGVTVLQEAFVYGPGNLSSRQLLICHKIFFCFLLGHSKLLRPFLAWGEYGPTWPSTVCQASHLDVWGQRCTASSRTILQPAKVTIGGMRLQHGQYLQCDATWENQNHKEYWHSAKSWSHVEREGTSGRLPKSSIWQWALFLC